MKRLIAGLILALGVTCAMFPLEAQQAGGAFVPSFNYDIAGAWNFSGTIPTLTGNGSVVGTTATQTLTLKTLTSPTITGATMTTATLTAPTIATITNTGTLTLPTATGGLPVALNCGATGTGNQTCAPTTATALTKVYAGTSTLASNAAIITFPTPFAATTSYQCVANDITTRANPVQMLSTSTSTATITNTTGASDVINWICVGQ
jgi:hypothetical protein